MGERSHRQHPAPRSVNEPHACAGGGVSGMNRVVGGSVGVEVVGEVVGPEVVGEVDGEVVGSEVIGLGLGAEVIGEVVVTGATVGRRGNTAEQRWVASAGGHVCCTAGPGQPRATVTGASPEQGITRVRGFPTAWRKSMLTAGFAVGLVAGLTGTG